MKKMIAILFAALFSMFFCSFAFAGDVYINGPYAHQFEDGVVKPAVSFSTCEDGLSSVQILIDGKRKYTISTDRVTKGRNNEGVMLLNSGVGCTNQTLVFDETGYKNVGLILGYTNKRPEKMDFFFDIQDYGLSMFDSQPSSDGEDVTVTFWVHPMSNDRPAIVNSFTALTIDGFPPVLGTVQENGDESYNVVVTLPRDQVRYILAKQDSENNYIGTLLEVGQYQLYSQIWYYSPYEEDYVQQ